MIYLASSKTLITLGILFSSTTIIAKSLDITEKTNQTPNTFHQCVNSDYEQQTTQRPNSAGNPNPVKDAIYLEADTGKIVSQGTSLLNGNVVIQQNTTVFTANSAQVNRVSNEVTAQGNVVLSDTNFSLKSSKIKYNLENKTGTVDNAEYAVGTEGAHGKSSQIKLINDNNLQLKDASFTSCPVNKNSWHLASGDIRLNKETQIGTAKNVTLNVGDVPVFYFPWLKFPINSQRLSGFLSPRVKLQSNAGISIPYYFNIAPNYDATVRLTTIRNRGFQLDTEFRYLSEKHEGELVYNFIPNDESFDDEKRVFFKIKHETHISEKTNLKVNAEGVSDTEYFDDFSDSLETSTRPALQRRLEIIHDANPWSFSAAIEDFQVIDIDDDPYSKLPEIKLDYAPKSGPKDLKLSVNSELIYFDRDDDITGVRADIKVKVGKKWGQEAWYFKPTLSLQHTLYSLDNAIGESQINRTLPTLTFDSGLFFDRDIPKKSVNSNSYTQTIEPRLFYTFTPFTDQSDIPVFDTSRNDFSESNQLFLENRFTGKDRIADTNQLTFAVSTRIQDRDNGNEIFKATLGQVFNFSDRKVTLPGGTILTGKRSDLLLELTGRLNDNFRLASTISLKSDDKSISNYDLRLNYQDDKKNIANLSFRKLDTELEQISFSTAIPINNKWSMVASSDFDTLNDRNLESLIGFEYQDCCWKTRVVAKRFLTSDNVTYENPIFIEFELKGLGKVGTSATRQIKEKIYGYDDF
ncbi:MAG: LPS-assembly protein LptD [Cocleimonas sp.]